MKHPTHRIILALSLAIPVLAFNACGKKAETKTVIIERQAPAHVVVETRPEPQPTIVIHGNGKNGSIDIRK